MKKQYWLFPSIILLLIIGIIFITYKQQVPATPMSLSLSDEQKNILEKGDRINLIVGVKLTGSARNYTNRNPDDIAKERAQNPQEIEKMEQLVKDQQKRIKNEIFSRLNTQNCEIYHNYDTIPAFAIAADKICLEILLKDPAIEGIEIDTPSTHQ